MKPRLKVIELNGAQYQLRKMRANAGSYILTRVLAAGISAGTEEDAAKGMGSVFATFLRGLDFETFSFIQNACLTVVNRLEPSNDGVPTPIPIVTDTGEFVDPDVEGDLGLVMGLTIQSLLFNVMGFFEDGGLSALTPR